MTQLRLLLKFANYDSGKRDEIDFDDSATVAELKQHILSEHWPSTGLFPAGSCDRTHAQLEVLLFAQEWLK